MGRGNPALGGWGERITSAENLLEFDSPELEDRRWITSWVISLLVTAGGLETLKLQRSPGHPQLGHSRMVTEEILKLWREVVCLHRS